MVHEEILDLDLEMRLINNRPIYGYVGYLYSPTINEITDIGLSIYNIYTTLLCSSFDKLKEIENTKSCTVNTAYEWLSEQCLFHKDYEPYILSGLSVFFREKVSFSGYLFYIGDIQEKRYINEEIFNYIQEIIKKICCVEDNQKEEKPIFGNKKAEEMWKKIQENKKKLNDLKNNKNTLPSIISGLAWKSKLGIQEIGNLSIYQLYDGYNRLGLIDNYDYTMQGIYHGTIDGKSTNIKELDWSKSIDNK